VQIKIVFCFLLMRAVASGAPTSQPAMITFPIKNPGQLLMIPLTVNGKPAYFVFDTGASTTVLDSQSFPSLRPTGSVASGDTAGGSVTMQPFEPPKLSIGPWNLADGGPVLCTDLSPFRALTDMPVIGILGDNVWRGWVVQMDFDAHELRFFRPDNHPHPEWGTSIPIEGDNTDSNGTPKIRLILGDFEDLFEIDTGYILNSLPAEYGFDHVLRTTNRRTITDPVMTMAGRSMQRLMRAPSFQVSGLHYNDLLFYETKVWDGILGLEFLSRHLVTLDWPNHRLYLKPGKEFDRYDEHDMSGLGLQRLDSKTIVNLASPDQPGYQAGLRDGDELLAINGKSASNYALYDLTDLLRSKDGLKITVKFRRGNVIQTTSFLLRKEI
jgi:hypothetical protein